MDCLVYEHIGWLLFSFIDVRNAALRTSEQITEEVLTLCAQTAILLAITGDFDDRMAHSGAVGRSF